MEKSKIAIVASGGGMTCSYAAGAVSALASYYRFQNPDIVIGGSGSSGTLAYYVSGQYGSITKLWGSYLSTKRFINPLRFWKLIDIDYLIDEVFKKEDRLKTSEVMKSDIDLYIAATNYKTGKLHYFSNRTMGDEEEIFDILRASKAMPIAYNKRIKISGEKFCDSYLSSYPHAHIKKAVELGAKDIVLIDSRPEGARNEAVFKLWLSTQGANFRRNYYEEFEKSMSYDPPEDVKIVLIKPKFPVKADTFNSKKEDLAEAIQRGHDDVVNSMELKEMLERRG